MAGATQQEEKSAGWYTAFYQFAQYVGGLSDGAVNHKQLYAMVGSLGSYVNNDDSGVRRRTAAMLSHLVPPTCASA